MARWDCTLTRTGHAATRTGKAETSRFTSGYASLATRTSGGAMPCTTTSSCSSMARTSGGASKRMAMDTTSRWCAATGTLSSSSADCTGKQALSIAEMDVCAPILLDQGRWHRPPAHAFPCRVNVRTIQKQRRQAVCMLSCIALATASEPTMTGLVHPRHTLSVVLPTIHSARDL
ncbi:hypothetical protein H310_04440 [Aphanomyces invadans]|uniref:Uncharacterized protein n=1 Tax=Aphanomyces invadans TaxID=157072 RepID=A0A024UDT8_9STRA|nr:hypothetical protein H310_04440 [Aphanomyces invadans]ETW04057.1 hypothetical protein H310_04440 [Aphanomyces invadans]|eukprot:XP_008867013.1 hypothetical protein H310_04440 [Aphanomyces invadans]